MRIGNKSLWGRNCKECLHNNLVELYSCYSCTRVSSTSRSRIRGVNLCGLVGSSYESGVGQTDNCESCGAYSLC